MASAISFHLIGQIMSFMIGIPTEMIDTRDAVPVEADAELRTKLNGLVQFAPDDGPYMRLMDADDPVVTAPGAAVKHLLLLEIEEADDPVLAKLFGQ